MDNKTIIPIFIKLLHFLDDEWIINSCFKKLTLPLLAVTFYSLPSYKKNLCPQIAGFKHPAPLSFSSLKLN